MLIRFYHGAIITLCGFLSIFSLIFVLYVLAAIGLAVTTKLPVEKYMLGMSYGTTEKGRH